MHCKTTDITHTRKRYERIAPFYNMMESPMETLRFTQWRSRLREKLAGKKALEVGVGTGKNILYYPSEVDVTAIDISPSMRVAASGRGREGL
jgi:ubiquinone/menaquinone biosynthesis C-methylase UbiE